MPEIPAVSRYRQISQERVQEFIRRGVPARHFFPHRSYYLPKCGPDALRLAQDMCRKRSLKGHVELVLYCDSVQMKEFPEGIFFADDLIWHRQHFGRAGHIAFAYLFKDGRNLYGLNYVSDLVQRISRKREYATRVEKLFHGWHHMLLNSILNFAVENGVDRIYSPVSAFVLAHTDKARTPKKELFERVYDRAVQEHFSATQENDWWVIDVQANRDRLVVPETREDSLFPENTICISHDIERGFGHAGIDEKRTKIADRIGPEALAGMIRCEDEAGLKATYNVVGCFFNEVRSEIESSGHCLAFHSYDHVIRKYWGLTKHYWHLRRILASRNGNTPAGKYHDQLYRCRLVDRRVRGFRLPQSRTSAEWTDRNLVYRNFEWCGTSSQQLGSAQPILENGLVKIPIGLDDFPLYKSGVSFREWEKRLTSAIEKSRFIAFGLHDCYADLWLPHYSEFLRKISKIGKFKTLDTVANETLFAHAL